MADSGFLTPAQEIVAGSPCLNEIPRDEWVARLQVMGSVRRNYISGKTSDGDAVEIMMRRLGLSFKDAIDMTIHWDDLVALMSEGLTEDEADRALNVELFE